MTRLLAIFGPTASGKSRVSAWLAEQLDAEIISLDSMKVYRGLDKGTAKPSPELRARHTWHLLDCVALDEPFDVHRYVSLAEQVLADGAARGRRCLFSGGTGLYLKGLSEGIFAGPPADRAFRAELAAWEQAGNSLHARLAEQDPQAAARIHANDSKRLVRALEVFRATGRSISAQHEQFGRLRPGWERRIFALVRERPDLNQRIEARVDTMLAAGLVDEARAIFTNGKALARGPAQAIGYHQLFAHFRGEIPSLAEAVDRIKRDTRRFARKQCTWFNSFPDLIRVPVAPADTAEAVGQRILARLEQDGWGAAPPPALTPQAPQAPQAPEAETP